MSVFIRFWGDYACFTRPEMKAERVSYDVMTPSAARGALEAIYWHPGINWHIHNIWVCRPIKFIGVRRNELKNFLSTSSLLKSIKSQSYLPTCDLNEQRTQRASLILKDVEYVVEASYSVNPKLYKSEIPGTDVEKKATKIIMGRLTKGGYYHHPCLGCREFPANFELIQNHPDCSSVFPGTKDLGWMFWDWDFRASKETPKQIFFRAEMYNGKIKIPDRRDLLCR